ncbi:MAG: hypothetical protein Q8P19_02395, partial [bacterium]|nr:hypothetical protein [bacterium]
ASFASSYIPTTTAAVARNADVLTYQFAGNASATAGTAYAEVMVEHPGTLATDTVAVAFSNASSIGTLRAGNVANTVINIRDGTQTVSKSGLTDMQTAIRKRASAWGGSTMAITGDGATVASGSFDGDLGSIAIAIGCDSAGGRTWFGTIKNVRIWTSQLPNGELQVITT